MSSPPQNRSAIAEPLGADRELALIHVPANVREALRALFAIDAAMADVVAKSSDPALGRIKLAWWRERLEELDEADPPAEPRLQQAAAELLPHGLTGAQLAELEEGWATLLDAEPDPNLVGSRGALLFEIGGRLLASDDEFLADAGALYALASVGRRGVPEMLKAAPAYLDRLRGHRIASRLRPLTMLAKAAARDLRIEEPEGSRGRALAMMAHRWGGRIS